MKISDFDFSGEREQGDAADSLIYDFNRTDADFPRHVTAHGLFEKMAASRPEADAAVYGKERMTYGELDERSNQLARLLIDAGVGKETFAGVMLDRSPDWLVAVLGVMKAGGAYFPVHPNLPFDRMRHMLLETRSRILISQKRHIRNLNKLQWECPDLKAVLCVDSDDILSEMEPSGELMDESLWDYVGGEAFDDISGGGVAKQFYG